MQFAILGDFTIHGISKASLVYKAGDIDRISKMRFVAVLSISFCLFETGVYGGQGLFSLFPKQAHLSTFNLMYFSQLMP